MAQPLDIVPVSLDFNKRYLHEIVSIQGDTGRAIEFTIVKNNKPIDLTNENVRMFGIKPDGNRIFNDATITNPTSGKCLVELTSQMLVRKNIHDALKVVIINKGKGINDMSTVVAMSTINELLSLENKEEAMKILENTISSESFDEEVKENARSVKALMALS